MVRLTLPSLDVVSRFSDKTALHYIKRKSFEEKSASRRKALIETIEDISNHVESVENCNKKFVHARHNRFVQSCRAGTIPRLTSSLGATDLHRDCFIGFIAIALKQTLAGSSE